MGPKRILLRDASAVPSGRIDAARLCADTSRGAGDDLLGGLYDVGYFSILTGFLAVAAGDLDTAESADERAWGELSQELSMVKINLWRRAAVALARGDLDGARQWADDAVARTTGWHRAVALTMRARVAIAQGDTQQAERDAQGASAKQPKSMRGLGFRTPWNALRLWPAGTSRIPNPPGCSAPPMVSVNEPARSASRFSRLRLRQPSTRCETPWAKRL